MKKILPALACATVVSCVTTESADQGTPPVIKFEVEPDPLPAPSKPDGYEPRDGATDIFLVYRNADDIGLDFITPGAKVTILKQWNADDMTLVLRAEHGALVGGAK